MCCYQGIIACLNRGNDDDDNMVYSYRLAAFDEKNICHNTRNLRFDTSVENWYSLPLSVSQQKEPVCFVFWLYSSSVFLIE